MILKIELNLPPSADAANNFNAEGLANPERILNYLLRQQSENAYLKSKNRWILKFLRVFLDFLIFLILDGFELVLLWISTPWLDFLPGAGLKSPGHEISSLFKFSRSYGVHVPTHPYTKPPQIFFHLTPN